MRTWPGHLLITHTALLHIVNKVAAAETVFSRDECVLFTACEFWAAVSTGELRTHLGSLPAERLRAAGIALNSLGAVVLARDIFTEIDELRNLKSRTGCLVFIERLEQRLRLTVDPVDVLIGLLAQRCIPATMPGRLATMAAHPT